MSEDEDQPRIHFERPVAHAEKGVCISRARITGTARPVRLHLREARIHAVHSVRGAEGTGSASGSASGPMVLQLLLAREEPAHELVERFDAVALDKVLRENEAWFRNNLSEEAIRAFFRASLAPAPLGAGAGGAGASLFTVLVSEQKGPIEIRMDGQDFDSFRALAREGIVGRTCTLELEMHGLCFYPNRCGVRWVVRAIEVVPPTLAEEEVLAGADRAEIEASWRETVEECRARAEEKISALRAAVGRMDCLLREAEERPGPDKTWNRLLEQLLAETKNI